MAVLVPADLRRIQVELTRFGEYSNAWGRQTPEGGMLIDIVVLIQW